MKSKTPIEALKEAILLLEAQQIKESTLLKIEFKTVCESLKPMNLLRQSMQEISHTHDLKKDLLQVGLDIASSYFLRKINTFFK